MKIFPKLPPLGLSLLLVAPILLVSGCGVLHEEQISVPAGRDLDPRVVRPSKGEWFPAAGQGSLDTDEVKALDAAKRHPGSSSVKNPSDCFYRISRTPTGMDVAVSFSQGFVADGSPLFTPGGHAIFELNSEFEVVRIIPGK